MRQEEDAQLRRRRERGTLCVAILGVVVAIITPIVTSMIPTSKENSCDAYLTSLADNMMLPYHYDLPQPYVNRTVLSMELAKLVEHSQAPRSQVRLIVVLGRFQVGKTNVVREQFMKKTNVYYHALEARAVQLGSDLDHLCGSQHLSKGHIQRIVGKVYEKSRQNITIIFDIPHNAEDADVTRVYEDLKGMVYDDAHRRPVLGVIILSNHYQVDAFPRDKGRFETLWVGDLEESFGGCVPHRHPLQRGVLLRQEAACLLVREPAPPGRLPGADDPAQRVVRVVSVARVVATRRAQTRPQLSSQRPSNANSPCTKRRGRLVGLIDWCCKLAPVRSPRAPVYVDF